MIRKKKKEYNHASDAGLDFRIQTHLCSQMGIFFNLPSYKQCRSAKDRSRAEGLDDAVVHKETALMGRDATLQAVILQTI